jgi:hypothetical protein
MKHFLKFSSIPVIVTGAILTLTSYTTVKTAKTTPVTAYTISLVGKTMVGTNEQWTWSLTNTNPGNGSNGTLQDVSHWDIALPPAAENALVAAEYSKDGNNWHSIALVVDRDPSIKMCTGQDVLKFEAGTEDDQPTYYRATFSQKFVDNAYATSYIKTGGGMKGCNLYYFSGMGTPRLD